MFQFKQFSIHQNQCAQKVSEVACIQGAWTSLNSSCKRVLDIGSGTGLLSLMLAQRYAVQIDAIEIDRDTFYQGKENISMSSFRHLIHPIHADVKMYTNEQQYDFIITNPPFFEKQLATNNEKENMAKHSSQLSLTQLIEKINELLNESGQFSILFPFDRMNELEKVCDAFQLHPTEYLIIKHSISHEPKVFVGIFSKVKASLTKQNFIIKENGIYTAQMKELTSDFYL